MNPIKVSEFARATAQSRENVYHWINIGVIPKSCVLRIGGSIRLDSDECMRLLREGKLARRRTRKVSCEPLNAEDSHTTRGGRLDDNSRCEHRFVGEDGRVHVNHPYSPAMKR